MYLNFNKLCLIIFCVAIFNEIRPNTLYEFFFMLELRVSDIFLNFDLIGNNLIMFDVRLVRCNNFAYCIEAFECK